MTPEAGYFLEKARKLLEEAESILAISIHDVAGRTAYLAGFHAAQALIFERTGKSVKTHKGVHAQLHRLAKDEPGFDAGLRAFLSQNYDLKTIADCETGPAATVSAERATRAVKDAKRFVAWLEHRMSPTTSDPS